MKYSPVFTSCVAAVFTGCAQTPQQPTLTPEDITRAGQANIDRLGVESFSVLVKIAETYQGQPDGDRALRRAMFLYADLLPHLKQGQESYMEYVRVQTTERVAKLSTEGKLKEARELAIAALASQYGDTNKAIRCEFKESVDKPNPLTFKSNILLSTLPMLDKMDPREITHETICQTLKYQLLTKAFGSVTSQVAPLKDWVYINPNKANVTVQTPTPGQTK